MQFVAQSQKVGGVAVIHCEGRLVVRDGVRALQEEVKSEKRNKKTKERKSPPTSRKIIRDAKCALRRIGASGYLSRRRCFIGDTNPINPSFRHLHDDEIRHTLLFSICHYFVVSRTAGNHAFILFRERNPSI